MKAFGRFEGGVFYRNEGVEGRRATDAHQATWEFVHERPMPEPQPQYTDPFLMNTHAYRWTPVAGAPGVEEKTFGAFTDCRVRSASYKLDPGASFRAAGRGIFVVLSGRGSLENGPFRALTAAYLDSNENATFRADDTAEILLFGLPEVARMRRWPEALVGAAAGA
jgi:redox-sensitive bicupin YhaK (pirin superfamily)